jgi:hypothetical protein
MAQPIVGRGRTSNEKQESTNDAKRIRASST